LLAAADLFSIKLRDMHEKFYQSFAKTTDDLKKMHDHKFSGIA